MPIETITGFETRRTVCKVISVDAEKKNELGGIGEMTVWASTEELDHYGEVVKSFAFNDSIATSLETKKWPPFLVAHMHALANGDVPVIGRVVFMEEFPGKGSQARIAFAPEDVQPLAMRWLRAFAGGWITDVSVGFRAIDIEREEGEPLTHTRSALLELSAAAVGACPSATAISVSTKSLDGAPADVIELMKNLQELETLTLRAAGLFQVESTKQIEETENEFAARIRDSDDFVRLRRFQLQESPKVDAVGGPLKSDPDGGSKVQSVKFPKDAGWTKDRATAWVKEHRDSLKEVQAHTIFPDSGEQIIKWGDIEVTIPAWVERDQHPTTNVNPSAGGAGELTQDDTDIFVQITPRDVEYVSGSVREIRLVQDPPVFAQVGKLAEEGADAQDRITFLRFPKAADWSENTVLEWLQEVNLDTLLNEALSADGPQDGGDDNPADQQQRCACEAVAKSFQLQIDSLAAQVVALASVKDAALLMTSRLATYLDQVNRVAAPAATSESGSEDLPEVTPGELAEIQKDLTEAIETGERLQPTS